MACMNVCMSSENRGLLSDLQRAAENVFALQRFELSFFLSFLDLF